MNKADAHREVVNFSPHRLAVAIYKCITNMKWSNLRKIAQAVFLLILNGSRGDGLIFYEWRSTAS
jgi:hypothetical protein